MKSKVKAGQPLAPALASLLLGESHWMIRAGAMPRLLEFEKQIVASGPTREALAFFDDEELYEADDVEPVEPGVRTIPLTGVLVPHGFSSFFFGSSRGVQGFRDQLAAAVADPNVVGIVLDVDSPGGSVGLVPEAAADVRAAREIKPVIAVANTLAASGAYYIAAQASEFYVTPSGEVGSIGVYYVHYDYSRMNDRVGIQVTYISEGKHKIEGNPDEPLSTDAQEAWQADAKTLYDMFVADVAEGRGVSEDAVRNGFGEGRCLLAQDALAAGMVDGVDTLQNVRNRLLADSTAAIVSGASARRLGRAATPPRAAKAEDAAAGNDPGDLETEPVPPETDVPAEDVDVDGPGKVDETPADDVADDVGTDTDTDTDVVVDDAAADLAVADLLI